MNGIKSKQRVELFGEVNTSKKEVNSMLELVESETFRLDSRFLEPACGDGNFLIEVLKRKLSLLVKQYKKNQYEFEKNSIVVIGSIYAIDILEDNILLSRERLFSIFTDIYEKIFKKSINTNLLKSIKFILERNIIHGNALTLNYVNNNQPIIFSEWSMLSNKIKRRDFMFTDLIAYAPFEEGTLFSDLDEEVIIPKSIEDFKLINFDQIYKHARK